jgi:hypothetical protein
VYGIIVAWDKGPAAPIACRITGATKWRAGFMTVSRRMGICLLPARLALADWNDPVCGGVYQLRTGGTLAMGPSVPGDWQLANCCPTLAAAAPAAAPAGSVLLGSRSLVASPDSATVACSGGQPCAVEVEGCRFRDFQATGTAAAGGSAVRATANAGGTVLAVTGCGFFGNRTEGPGGAVFAGEGVDLAFRGCRFEGNESAEPGARGGAVAVRAAAAPGTGNGDGGALMIKGSRDRPVEVQVERSGFTANDNAQGAGIYIGRCATGVVRRCRFTGNRAWYQGDAAMKGGALVYNHGETATFDSCEFVGNEAGCTPDGAPTGELARGGALALRNRPRAVVRHCTFVDNRVSDPHTGWGDAVAHAREGGSRGAGNRCVLPKIAVLGRRRQPRAGVVRGRRPRAGRPPGPVAGDRFAPAGPGPGTPATPPAGRSRPASTWPA